MTLADVHFSESQLSMMVHGASTVANVNGGSITGGMQGVAVHAGASLNATNLTITSVEVTDVEVKDSGSFLEMNSCKLGDLSSEHTNSEISVRGCMCIPTATQPSPMLPSVAKA